MWWPFTLTEGSEWGQSLAVIDPRPERFEKHLASMRYALKRDPGGWTEGFLSTRGDLRIYRSSDPYHGYEVVVFVRVDEPNHACELKWIETRGLAPDEEIDEGPHGLP